MKLIILILITLQSILIVNAQNMQNREVYLQRIITNDSLLSNTRLKDKEKCVYLKENNYNKDSIIFLLDSKISELEHELDVCEQRLKAYEQELKVKDFFFCPDTTVFGSKFIEIDIDKYPTHIREFYQLVRDIRDVNLKLISIGEVVNKINTNDLTKDLDEADKQNILQKNTQTQISELHAQLSKIENSDMSLLSIEQIEFYEGLKLKFSNLIDTIL